MTFRITWKLLDLVHLLHLLHQLLLQVRHFPREAGRHRGYLPEDSVALLSRAVNRANMRHHVVFALELLAADMALVGPAVRVDGDVMPVEVGRVGEGLEALGALEAIVLDTVAHDGHRHFIVVAAPTAAPVARGVRSWGRLAGFLWGGGVRGMWRRIHMFALPLALIDPVKTKLERGSEGRQENGSVEVFVVL